MKYYLIACQTTAYWMPVVKQPSVYHKYDALIHLYLLSSRLPSAATADGPPVQSRDAQERAPQEAKMCMNTLNDRTVFSEPMLEPIAFSTPHVTDESVTLPDQGPSVQWHHSDDVTTAAAEGEGGSGLGMEEPCRGPIDCTEPHLP